MVSPAFAATNKVTLAHIIATPRSPATAENFFLCCTTSLATSHSSSGWSMWRFHYKWFNLSTKCIISLSLRVGPQVGVSAWASLESQYAVSAWCRWLLSYDVRLAHSLEWIQHPFWWWRSWLETSSLLQDMYLHLKIFSSLFLKIVYDVVAQKY